MKCRACQSTTLEWLCPVNDMQDQASYYCCTRCKSYNASQSWEDIKWLYSADHIQHSLNDYGSYESLERLFTGHLSMVLNGPEHKRSCLDIGCLEGAFLGLIARNGYEVFGFDVEPAVRELASARAGCPSKHIQIANNFQASLFPQVGVVHCSEVIEHVENPAEFLKQIHDVLLPGGLLVLQTPRPICDFRGGWNQGAHLCIIDPEQLCRLAQAVGLNRLPKHDHIWDVGQLFMFQKGGVPASAPPRISFVARTAARLGRGLNRWRRQKQPASVS